MKLLIRPKFHQKSGFAYLKNLLYLKNFLYLENFLINASENVWTVVDLISLGIYSPVLNPRDDIHQTLLNTSRANVTVAEIVVIITFLRMGKV